MQRPSKREVGGLTLGIAKGRPVNGRQPRPGRQCVDSGPAHWYFRGLRLDRADSIQLGGIAVRLNPFDYWTIAVLRRLWPYMTIGSVLRYRAFRDRVADGKASPDRRLTLSMKVPFAGPINLREGWPDLDSFSEVFLQGVYNGAVERFPECRKIIDLGAHIGLATLFFAIKYPQARIASVEPHPVNYELLTENLRPLIAEGRCVPIRAAVWSTERWLQPDPTRPLERFNAFAVQESIAGQEGSLRVEGISIASIMEKASFESVDLVKMDIEGSEVELFRKNTDWLASVRALAIEFHGSSRSDCDFDDTMRRYGFTVHDEGSHTVIAAKHHKPD